MRNLLLVPKPNKAHSRLAGWKLWEVSRVPVLLGSVSRGAARQSRPEAQAWASPAPWGLSRCGLTAFFSITPCWSILSTGVRLGRGGKKNRVLGADRAPFCLRLRTGAASGVEHKRSKATSNRAHESSKLQGVQ